MGCLAHAYGVFFLRSLAYIFLITLCGLGPLQGEVVLVASKASGLTEISMSELLSIYSGRSRKVSGKTVKPIMLKGGPIHDEFCRNYIRKSSSSLSKIWKKLVFTGKASMIKTYSSDEEMKREVASNPDVIGYLDRQKVDESLVILKIK